MYEDKIRTVLLDRGDRLESIKENMVTKRDHEQVVQTLDEILGVVKDNKQELVMMGSRVSRIDRKVEEHDMQIKKLNTGTGLV